MELPPVLAMAEVMELLGLSRGRVGKLMGMPEFPEPIATLSVGRVWASKDIEDYARRTGRTLRPPAAG